MPPVLTIAAVVCDLLAVAGAVYFALCVWAARRFRRELERDSGGDFAPPVSVMKSLKGLDPHMYAAFRSHCVFDYDEYELLFGASDLNEPALELVRKLQGEFPKRQIRVVPCPKSLGTNGKVSTLAQLVPEAKYEHILIN